MKTLEALREVPSVLNPEEDTGKDCSIAQVAWASVSI